MCAALRCAWLQMPSLSVEGHLTLALALRLPGARPAVREGALAALSEQLGLNAYLPVSQPCHCLAGQHGQHGQYGHAVLHASAWRLTDDECAQMM